MLVAVMIIAVMIVAATTFATILVAAAALGAVREHETRDVLGVAVVRACERGSRKRHRTGYEQDEREYERADPQTGRTLLFQLAYRCSFAHPQVHRTSGRRCQRRSRIRSNFVHMHTS